MKDTENGRKRRQRAWREMDRGEDGMIVQFMENVIKQREVPMNKTLCSMTLRSMVKRRGCRVVQKVLPSIRPIWALAGWWRRRCFFGGTMSCKT
ncbi:hypothetical protein EYF80_040583 [Liparis tanakae]|uniref:Uncharacterized protein n=1 Tax=Liparis tanakae TaxID=230148 RepID=A0A4Z2G6M2_9TELE|nr:hypothetical protein EYF80_040583 [Liparis tanakae]